MTPQQDQIDTVWSMLIEAGDENPKWTAEKIVTALAFNPKQGEYMLVPRMTTPADSVELLPVTQEDREAAADYLRTLNPDATWNNDGRDAVMFIESVLLGQEDSDPLVEAFAAYRTRLSAESAHAGCCRAAIEKSARLALMYLETGFVACEHCGHEFPTKELDAAYELRDTLASVNTPPASAEGWPSREAVARALYCADEGIAADVNAAHLDHWFGQGTEEAEVADYWRQADAILALFRSPPTFDGMVLGGNDGR